MEDLLAADGEGISCRRKDGTYEKKESLWWGGTHGGGKVSHADFMFLFYFNQIQGFLVCGEGDWRAPVYHSYFFLSRRDRCIWAGWWRIVPSQLFQNFFPCHQMMLRIKRNWGQLFSEMKVQCKIAFEVAPWFFSYPMEKSVLLLVLFGSDEGNFSLSVSDNWALSPWNISPSKNSNS